MHMSDSEHIAQNNRRITDWDNPQPMFTEKQSKPISKAEEARIKATAFIRNGATGIIDRILARVEEESSRGRFNMSHLIKAQDVHLVSLVITALTEEGFKVEKIGAPTQREPEQALNISW